MARTSLKAVSRLIDAANNKKSVEEEFLNDLCRSIEITAEKGCGLPSKTFKPSSMNCKRGCYYQIMGIEPDKGNASHTMIGICDSGSDIHVRIQSAVEGMKENGMDCEYIDVEDFVAQRGLPFIKVRGKIGAETKLYNEQYNISFMCDGIIKYKGRYYILEIKTETSNKWYTRTGVDKKHYKQAIAYSLSLGLDYVIFLYVDRDMNNKKTYMFEVTDKMREDLVSFIKDVDGYVGRQIVPPKDEDIPKRICQYCSYQTQCRRDR